MPSEWLHGLHEIRNGCRDQIDMIGKSSFDTGFPCLFPEYMTGVCTYFPPTTHVLHVYLSLHTRTRRKARPLLREVKHALFQLGHTTGPPFFETAGKKKGARNQTQSGDLAQHSPLETAGAGHGRIHSSTQQGTRGRAQFHRSLRRKRHSTLRAFEETDHVRPKHLQYSRAGVSASLFRHTDWNSHPPWPRLQLSPLLQGRP